MRTLIALWLIFGAAALAQAPAPEHATGGAPVVSETLAAQVMLDRLAFSPGEIDGRPGENLERALAAYQQSRGLAATRALDEHTWQRLTQETRNVPPLIEYVLAPADVAGPFTPNIPGDLVQQGRLEMLGYRTALESIGEKFHASPGLLRQINVHAAFARAGERILVPNVLVVDLAAVSPAASNVPAVTIAVSKSTSALTVEDASGQVLFHAPVTTGSEHDPLPIGTWNVTGVQRNPAFHYNPALFWDANPKHEKARIAPGPNNPVGIAWIDITREHYGIHGTPEPSRIGHVQSHGCVRLTNWDVGRLLAWVRPGTRVVFRS